MKSTAKNTKLTKTMQAALASIYVAPYFTSDAEASAAWAQFAIDNAKHQAEQTTRVVERARASRVAAGKVTDAAWEITARELVAEHGWLKIDRAMDAKGVAKY
jgi:hypothetical protein